MAELALRESEEKYRSLVEDSFDGIFIQKGTRIIFANRRLNEVLGYEEGELVDVGHWMGYHISQVSLRTARAYWLPQGFSFTQSVNGFSLRSCKYQGFSKYTCEIRDDYA